MGVNYRRTPWDVFPTGLDGKLLLPENHIERFWRKVDAGSADECWEWTGNRDKDNYARFRLRDNQIPAHRLAWLLERGPLIDGYVVHHRCANRACVNPSHLDQIPTADHYFHNRPIPRTAGGGTFAPSYTDPLRPLGYKGKGAVRPPEERFWEHVFKLPCPYACWIWKTAGKDGRASFMKSDMERKVKPPRFALELLVGHIGAGLEACHRCDNPRCVRAECHVLGCQHGRFSPDCQSHIFIGTHRENMQDMVAKGRNPRPKGDEVYGAELTEATVTEMLDKYAAGKRTSSLAREYGVSYPTVHSVISGRTWRHVPRPDFSHRVPEPLRPSKPVRPHCKNGHPFDEANTFLCVDGRRRKCRRCAGERTRRANTRTHCKYGHPLSGENLYVCPGTTYLSCKTCALRRSRESKRRKALR